MNPERSCARGAFCAQLGSTSATNGDSSIAQTFTAPSGATGLSLWYKETCPDTVTYDWALVTLKDNTAGTTATLLAKVCATRPWTNVTGSLTAGLRNAYRAPDGVPSPRHERAPDALLADELLSQDVCVPAVLGQLAQYVEVHPAQRERATPVAADHVVQPHG